MELNNKVTQRLEQLIYEAEQQATVYYSELDRRLKEEESLGTSYMYNLLLSYTRALNAVVRELQLQLRIGETNGND